MATVNNHLNENLIGFEEKLLTCYGAAEQGVGTLHNPARKQSLPKKSHSDRTQGPVSSKQPLLCIVLLPSN